MEFEKHFPDRIRARPGQASAAKATYPFIAGRRATPRDFVRDPCDSRENSAAVRDRPRRILRAPNSFYSNRNIALTAVADQSKFYSNRN